MSKRSNRSFAGRTLGAHLSALLAASSIGVAAAEDSPTHETPRAEEVAKGAPAADATGDGSQQKKPAPTNPCAPKRKKKPNNPCA